MTLDLEMLSSPNTLQVLITGFASIDESMALESMVLGLPDHEGSCKPSEIF